MKNFNEFIEETFVYGGGSYNPIFGTSPRGGFMASIEGTEIITSATNKRYLKQILNSFLGENFDLLNKSDRYIGTWICEDRLYIDVSVNFQSKKEALKFGVYNSQDAIFDIDNNRCIYLPKKQTSGTLTQQKTYIDLQIDKLLND